MLIDLKVIFRLRANDRSCALSKNRIVLTVLARKNPGEGCVGRVLTQKTLVRGAVAVFPLKNPGEGSVAPMFALKNPGEGVLLWSLSKTLARVVSVDCGRSQKPWWGFGVGRVRSQKPGSGVDVFALKNPWWDVC